MAVGYENQNKDIYHQILAATSENQKTWTLIITNLGSGKDKVTIITIML